jgi:hypothetical protein
MSFTKLQLYAITELISLQENIVEDDEGNPCLFTFICCTVVANESSNPEDFSKVIIVFYDIINSLEYNFIMFDDGQSLLLPL